MALSVMKSSFYFGDMIIYNAKPCREYPILAKEIQAKFKNHYQFHEPFEIVNVNDYKKNNGVLNYHPLQKIPDTAYFPCPETVYEKGMYIHSDLNGLISHSKFPKIPYNINFIYGVFPINRLVIHKNNFIFTLIDNPVDMIYNMFYFCKYSSSPKVKSLLRNVVGDFFQQPIEEFIDAFISEELNLEFIFNNVKYRVINEMFYLGDLSKYNYILFRDSLDAGLSNLTTLIKVRLNCHNVHSKIIENNSYRRGDLERYLKSDLEQYFLYKRKFEV